MLKNSVEYKRFVWELKNIIELNKTHKNIVFLCIGTTKIIGDSFGPEVGTALKRELYTNKNIEIIGDIKNALTYTEIEKNIEHISNKYSNTLTIVLDSALSSSDNIGKIFVQNRGLKYAECLKKQNKLIGDISIKAVVGKNVNNSIENFKNLKYVSIEKIKFMSDIVSNGIIDVVNKKENNGKNIYK